MTKPLPSDRVLMLVKTTYPPDAPARLQVRLSRAEGLTVRLGRRAYSLRLDEVL